MSLITWTQLGWINNISQAMGSISFLVMQRLIEFWNHTTPNTTEFQVMEPVADFFLVTNTTYTVERLML